MIRSSFSSALRSRISRQAQGRLPRAQLPAPLRKRNSSETSPGIANRKAGVGCAVGVRNWVVQPRSEPRCRAARLPLKPSGSIGLWRNPCADLAGQRHLRWTTESFALYETAVSARSAPTNPRQPHLEPRRCEITIRPSEIRGVCSLSSPIDEYQHNCRLPRTCPECSHGSCRLSDRIRLTC